MDTYPDLMPSLPLDLALDCLHRVPLPALSTLHQVCSSWRSAVSCPSFFTARLLKGYTQTLPCIIQAQSHTPSSPAKSPPYTLSLFHPLLQSWSSLPSPPDCPSGLPLFSSCLALGPHLVLLGGFDPSSWSVLSSVFIFDFSSSHWRRGAPIPTRRSFFASARIGLNKIAITGGHDDSKKALRSVEVYDLERDEWDSLPEMGQERDECKAVFLNGKLIVVSGFPTESQGQYVKSAESFDFAERRWDLVDNFWPASQAPSSIVALKDQLYALLDGNLVHRMACNNTWEPVLALPPGIKALSCVTPLRDGIFAVGLSGGAQPYRAFVCRIGTGSSPSTWQNLNGSACCGIVQHAACTIEV